MRSIRQDLTARLLLALLLIVVASGAASYLLIRNAVGKYFDETLDHYARALASLVEVETGGLDVDIGPLLVPPVMPGEPEEHFQLWLADGSTLYKTPTLGDLDLPRPTAPAIGQTAHFNLLLPSGRRGRAAALRFLPQFDDSEFTVSGRRVTYTPGEPITLLVVRERSDLDRLFRFVALGIAGVVVLALGAAVLAVRRSVGRGLQPLSALAGKTATIDATSLGERFDTSAVPRELAPVARTLNRLLERLARAFEHERAFNDNVAHELLTPIAELRSLAEVALKWDNDHELALRSLREAHDIARHQEHLVTLLLSIARCEAGRQRIDREEFDAIAILRDIMDSLGAPAALSDAAACTIVSDRAMVTSIFTNLLSNAYEYSPDAAAVDVRTEKGDGVFRLAVSNPAPDLHVRDLDRLFDAFWRKSPSGTTEQHSGLGLTLCQSFARLLGGRLDATLLDGRLTIICTLPLEAVAGETAKPAVEALRSTN